VDAGLSEAARDPRGGGSENAEGERPQHRGYPLSRALLIRQVYEVDSQFCARCGGAIKIIAVIERPAVIRQILDHLGLATTPSSLRAPHDQPAGWAAHSWTYPPFLGEILVPDSMLGYSGSGSRSAPSGTSLPQDPQGFRLTRNFAGGSVPVTHGSAMRSFRFPEVRRSAALSLLAGPFSKFPSGSDSVSRTLVL
jgi:hypothetical protein